MKYSVGIPRNQMRFTSLEVCSSQNNPARFIDAFVEHVSLDFVGFKVHKIKNESNIMGKLRDIDCWLRM